MEKELDRTGILLQSEEEKGAVLITDNCIGMIAALAATEVDGVYGLAGNITNELMSKVGVKNPTNGVKSIVEGSNVKVDISLYLEYGYNIPGTCQQVQSKVKTTIESMTGLECSEVNLRISGIHVKKDN